ncbi:unnamed protein product [Rhizophagus irregularis]|nr:unnamed protein product [Rhizophagus irregularis]
MAHYQRVARTLPTRPDIKELQFSGAHFSQGAIARLGQRLQTQYPNCKFQILLPYENWKPGQWTSGEEESSLFLLLDHYDEAQLPVNGGDPNYFDRFIIYVRNNPPAAGGCNGELNDCLYECLKHIYGTFSKMPKSIEKPEYIKKALGLNRDAPVPVSYMDKVEQLTKSLAINIVGDSTQISKSKSDRCATLILSEDHYSLALNPGRFHPSKLDRKRNLPIVYQEDGVKNVVTIYNGKTVKSCTIGQFQKTKNSKSSFIPIEKNRKTGETKKFGLGIDLSYHNWSYKRTALWLFERLSVGVPANDPLDLIEADWLSDAMIGGLIWVDNEWKGYGRQYDATSLYPSIQQSNANFPIRQGKFQILKDFVDHRGYALYGLFRAKKLRLDIQLIQDGKPNALIYDREARIPGTVIFDEYVHFLFKMKNQGGVAGRVAKRVLNTLWGALCQRKRNYKTLTTDQTDPFKFPEGHTLDSIIPVGSDQWRFQFTNPGNPFKGEYPRIAPFLLARGRKITSEAIQPYKDKVRRIHTDGFILEEQPDSPTLFACPENADLTLKTFKFEKEGRCHVKNANQIPIYYKVQGIMSTYTELASIINSTSEEVIYEASHVVSNETVLKIIRALKDTIVVALISGFSKTSYLVQDHVKYIKRIQMANSPISYVKFVARKLFPDNAAYTAKIAKIRESYKNKQALLDKLEALFELYYNVTKDSSTGPPKRAITMNEAENTLAELLA